MESLEKPVANPIVVLREEFDDWAVLFNPDTAAAVGINPIGVSIWKKLDGRHSLGDIVDHIQQAYRDVPANVSDDVNAFVSQLTEQGFIGVALE